MTVGSIGRLEKSWNEAGWTGNVDVRQTTAAAFAILPDNWNCFVDAGRKTLVD